MKNGTDTVALRRSDATTTRGRWGRRRTDRRDDIEVTAGPAEDDGELITHYRLQVEALELELAELRELIDRMVVDDTVVAGRGPFTPSAFALSDDDDEARAFDAFYHAYDGSHAKTRRFLLG
ncbi:MAG: hypothetical protein ACK5PP_18435 [Acidimicrobiales bacterium]